MRLLPRCRFTMGTSEAEAGHFCGESPSHAVELSAFHISDSPVTNELFCVYDRGREVAASDRHKPVVGVSWYEAAVFAMWMGCRLPTEAEWEFACGGGSPHQWCCADETHLARHAWYSANSDGVVHDVARREPNSLGLYDLHGNVWEWCLDSYDDRFYARAPAVDPVCGDPALYQPAGRFPEKVCRGGSVTSLAEMCRTRFRLHEAADFWAADLGFRLARTAEESGRR